MPIRMLAAAALLALPVLADGAPAAPSRMFTLVLTGGPQGSLAFNDLDSVTPFQIFRAVAKGLEEVSKGSDGKKGLTKKATFSRPWDGETSLASGLAQGFTSATFTCNLPPETAALEFPVLQEWILEADYGLSASETVRFEYSARRAEK